MLRMPSLAVGYVCVVAVLLATSGCASFRVPRSVPFAYYQAFGDSITYGAHLPDRSKAYPFLVAGTENARMGDYALGGDQACDIAPRQMFASGEIQSIPEGAVSSILVGTNDVDLRGVGAYEKVFMECHLAALSWQAVPPEFKVLAGGQGFSSSGPGAPGSLGVANAWTTQGPGATVSFTIDLREPGSIYAWPVLDDNVSAGYNYMLDGEKIGAARVRTPALLRTFHGTQRSLGFLRIGGVSAGSHTVTFVQTSSGREGVSILGIAAVGPGMGVHLPAIFAGTIPLQRHTGVQFGCQFSDDPCLQYNRDIEADVAVLASDGLNVKMFDTRKYFRGTADEMIDALHPNDLGHSEIAHSLEDSWATQ